LLGRTKTERSGGQKGRGLECHPYQEFLPALAFATSFFATAIFRASETGAPPEFNFILLDFQNIDNKMLWVYIHTKVEGRLAFF